jgi:hypothetical protein
VTNKIRSERSPLINGTMSWAEFWANWAGFGKFLRVLVFGVELQRRGAHVNAPKIGSRGELFCLGEFWDLYADLRRKFKWGN